MKRWIAIIFMVALLSAAVTITYSKCTDTGVFFPEYGLFGDIFGRALLFLIASFPWVAFLAFAVLIKKYFYKVFVFFLLFSLLSAAGICGSLNQYDSLGNVKNVKPWDTTGTKIIVVASDSSANVKAIADYKCDGTADQVQIQAAVDSLGTLGGTIELAAGTYIFSSSVNVTTNNIRFVGEGRNSIVTIGNEITSTVSNDGLSGDAGQKLVTVASGTGFAAGQKCIIRETTTVNGTDWEVVDIATVSGNDITLVANLTNSYTAGAGTKIFVVYNMFYLTDCHGIQFDGIKFDGNQENISVSLSEIENVGGTASDIWFIPIRCEAVGDTATDVIYDIGVTNCYFYAYYVNAFLFWNSSGTTEADKVAARCNISNNLFETVATYDQCRAIALEAFGWYSTVSNNKIQGGTVGIYAAQADFSSITGNTIDLGNTTPTEDLDESCIYLTSSDNCTIVGNTLRNSGMGIQLNDSDYNVISSNTINYCVYAMRATGDSTDDNTGNIITNNTISGKGYYGIARGATATVLNRTLISGNSFSNDLTATASGYVVVDLSTGINNRIINNYIDSTNIRKGVVMSGTGNIVGNHQGIIKTITADGAAEVHNETYLSKTTNILAATLADGQFTGQICKITSISTAAAGDHTLTIAHHTAGDAYVFYFDINEYVELQWDGDDWATTIATANGGAAD